MNQEIDALWRACSHAEARLAATNTVLSAVLAVVQDDPRFAAALRERRTLAEINAIMAEGKEDELTEVYRQKLDELTPQKLR